MSSFLSGQVFNKNPYQIFSKVIRSFFQEGKLSVSGESMYTSID